MPSTLAATRQKETYLKGRDATWGESFLPSFGIRDSIILAALSATTTGICPQMRCKDLPDVGDLQSTPIYVYSCGVWRNPGSTSLLLVAQASQPHLACRSRPLIAQGAYTCKRLDATLALFCDFVWFQPSEITKSTGLRAAQPLRVSLKALIRYSSLRDQ
jgi:hypothetical protein